jgi:hypothetical protein
MSESGSWLTRCGSLFLQFNDALCGTACALKALGAGMARPDCGDVLCGNTRGLDGTVNQATSNAWVCSRPGSSSDAVLRSPEHTFESRSGNLLFWLSHRDGTMSEVMTVSLQTLTYL